jgi:anti-anti-sigma factor
MAEYLSAYLENGKVILRSPHRLTVDDGALLLRRVLRTLVKNDLKDVIFDFPKQTYIDSAGIGEIVAAVTFLSREGGSFSLNNLPERMRDLLVITKLLSVFKCFENDYSAYTFLEITPDDLTPLLKAISLPQTDALSLLMTLTQGRIQILPSQKEGIYRLSFGDSSTGEMIIAAPYIIAAATRSYMRDEIEEFEEIINSPVSSEHDIQKFLEGHPKFLLGQEYQELYPQLVLEREGEEGPLIPDFLVKPFNRELCDIVDLKLPKASLIVGGRNRKRFSSGIAEAAAQLRTYRDYFDDPQRRQAVKSRYGITAFRPRLAVVVGRKAELDEVMYKQIQDGLSNIEILTYDDLIERAKKFLLL